MKSCTQTIAKITCEISDFIEPQERGDDEEHQLISHLPPPPQKLEQEIKKKNPKNTNHVSWNLQPHPWAPHRRERGRGKDEGFAHSDDGRERQEVGVQHGSHRGLLRLSSSSHLSLLLLLVLVPNCQSGSFYWAQEGGVLINGLDWIRSTAASTCRSGAAGRGPSKRRAAEVRPARLDHACGAGREPILWPGGEGSGWRIVWTSAPARQPQLAARPCVRAPIKISPILSGGNLAAFWLVG